MSDDYYRGPHDNDDMIERPQQENGALKQLVRGLAFYLRDGAECDQDFEMADKCEATLKEMQ